MPYINGDWVPTTLHETEPGKGRTPQEEGKEREKEEALHHRAEVAGAWFVYVVLAVLAGIGLIIIEIVRARTALGWGDLARLALAVTLIDACILVLWGYRTAVTARTSRKGVTQ